MTLQVGDWAEVIEDHMGLEKGWIVNVVSKKKGDVAVRPKNKRAIYYGFTRLLKPIKEDAPMPKYEVTREQQDTVDRLKKEKNKLEYVIAVAWKKDFIKKYNSLNGLDARTIIAMWDGVAEVKPEPVEHWQAIKAFLEGKKIKIVNNFDQEIFSHDQNVETTWNSLNPTVSTHFQHKFYIIEEGE